MKDLQIGDLVTYEVTEDNVFKILKMVIVDESDIQVIEINDYKVLKIERPKYETVFEKETELLTEDEKEFLKQYIKIIENLNNGKAESIYRGEVRLAVWLSTGMPYYIEVGSKFGNMQEGITYTLKELELE